MAQSPSPSPSKKCRFSEVKTVTLYVGEDKKAFHVHEDILFNASKVFRIAFNSNFKESSERTMTLPDEDEELFDRFIGCLYTPNYDVIPPPEGGDRPELEAARLFVLAEKYGVAQLAINICLKLVEYINNAEYTMEALPVSAVEFVYQNTPPNTIIRKIFADWVAYKAPNVFFHDSNTRPWLSDIPEFAADLAIALSTPSRSRYPRSPFPTPSPADYLRGILGEDLRHLVR